MSESINELFNYGLFLFFVLGAIFLWWGLLYATWQLWLWIRGKF